MNDPPRPGARPIRFGVFELDTQSRELRKSGVRLSVPEQSLQILECLLDRPGALIARDELRKRLWPSDTFVDFEHGLNAAVKRLRDVLGDSADSPRFVETVPRRGYRFLAPVKGGPNGALEQHEPAIGARPRRRLVWWGGAIGLSALVAAALAWKMGSSQADVTVAHAEMRVTPLATLTGWSGWPTFSPDGGQVAFSRSVDTGKDKSRNIYVQLVGSPESRQLLPEETDDFAPSWSPDGRHIAFLRRSATGNRIHLTSPFGGSVRKVSDFAAEAPMSWSPDGRYLAAQHNAGMKAEESGLWLVPVDGGSPRLIARAVVPAVNLSPSFSPDGRRLAYAQCEGRCRVAVMALNNDLTSSGGPVTLIPGTFIWVSTIAWTRDGQSLVFDAEDPGLGSRLLRAPADGSQAATFIDGVAGLNVSSPATSRTRDTLALVRRTFNVDVNQFVSGAPARGVVTSSLNEFQPAFSPDGTQLAFCSDRKTGHSVEVWVAAPDGSGAHPLTRGPSDCSPHWSPDGRSVVYDSMANGHRQLWTVDSEGGPPRQLTHGSGNPAMPSWSRDGLWVYFSADRKSGRNIWRVNVRDRTEQQLTQTGAGWYAAESADGLSLLFQPRDDDSPLLALPLGGGKVTQLVACVHAMKFAANPVGIYYVACDEGSDPRLRLLDPQTGRDRVLGKLEKLALGMPGLTVTSDGSTVLYSRLSYISADILLIENFK